MHISKIKWNEVNRFSQLIAIILFVLVFVLGFYLGKVYEDHALLNSIKEIGMAGAMMNAKAAAATATTDVTYTCDAVKTIRAIYHGKDVELFLSDSRHLTLPQVISASGARYANADESFVFWNKGATAFVTEGKSTTFANCVDKPQPQ